MAKPRIDLSAFVGKLFEEQDGDVLRQGILVLLQALMETEVAGLIGADRHERTPDGRIGTQGAGTGIARRRAAHGIDASHRDAWCRGRGSNPHALAGPGF